MQQRFKISNAYLSFIFLIKISSVGMRFLSLNKRNNLLPKLFDFAEFFRFARLPLVLQEKPILKIFGDGM